MTEYDYSPEAYEKYLATQSRIARWVDATQQTVLVGPDVPPTPVGPDENITLPRNRERKFRSRPEKSTKPSGQKSSRSTAARPPTPFEHTKELPVASDDFPSPGRPVYRHPWSPKSAKASTPHPETTSPEPCRMSTPHERRDSSVPRSRPSLRYNVISRELSEPVRPSYLPGYDSDNTYAKERAARKRSMSFSVAASRPLNNLSPVAHYPFNTPHHSSLRNHSANNPSSPFPSTVAVMPLPGPGPELGSRTSTNRFGYPLPYQHYSDSDAVRQHEKSLSHATPSHMMHQPVDSASYPYNIPGHSHQQSWHQLQPSQSYSRSSSRPPSPGFSVEPQPGSIRVTFPNGKILYMNPPNADRSRILQVCPIPICTALWWPSVASTLNCSKCLTSTICRRRNLSCNACYPISAKIAGNRRSWEVLELVLSLARFYTRGDQVSVKCRPGPVAWIIRLTWRQKAR